jgi:hypothetical protein
VGDRAEQPVADVVGARHRYPGLVGGGQHEVQVLEALKRHEPGLVVALVNDDLPVDLVGRRREERVGHHVEQNLRHHAVPAHERERFGHRLDGGSQHEVVRQLDRRGPFLLRARLERPSSDQLEQRCALAHRAVRPGSHDTKLSGGGGVGTTEHRRAHQVLAGFGMGGPERLNGGDAMRAHAQVNGTRVQRVANPAWTERDLLHCRIVGDHRDDHFASGAGVGDRRGDRRASAGQIGGFLPGPVVDDQVVATPEDPP